MCDSGEIKHDPNQEAAIKFLTEYVNESVYAYRLQLKRYKYDLSQLSNDDKNMSTKAWAKVN